MFSRKSELHHKSGGFTYAQSVVTMFASFHRSAAISIAKTAAHHASPYSVHKNRPISNTHPHSSPHVAVVKVGYGEEGALDYKGPYAFPDWKQDDDAVMYISGHGIDDEWHHCILHAAAAEKDAHSCNALYIFEYNNPKGNLFMVADLFIDEIARDIHITSAIVDYASMENQDIRLFEALLSRRIGKWILKNYLTSLFGPDWNIFINHRYHAPRRSSMLQMDFAKAKRMGRATLSQCKELHPDWGTACIICNM